MRARGFCLICLNTRCKQVAANMLMLAHRAAILLQKCGSFIPSESRKEEEEEEEEEEVCQCWC